MKRGTFGFLILFLGALARAESGDIVEKRTQRETIPLQPRETVLLVVDNVFGSITVTRHDAPRIEMTAVETTRARSRTAFDNARRDVTLDVGREGDEVRMYVDGPFRDRDEHGFGRSRSLGYTVIYDFEIKVPRRTRLDLSTVNSGDIRVEGVLGDLRARNVNGDVSLEHVGGGATSATTVNGPVTVRFDENPTEDSMFSTVNGNVELWLQPGLSADLRFKTFNGEARTDFDVEPLPSGAIFEKIDGDRRIFRGHEWARVRAGRGGPELSFETLNGNILIRNARGESASR